MAMATSKPMSLSIPAPLPRLSATSIPSSPTSPTSPSGSSPSSVSQPPHSKNGHRSCHSISSGSPTSDNTRSKFPKLLQLHPHHSQHSRQSHRQNSHHQQDAQKPHEFNRHAEGLLQQQQPIRHQHHYFFSSKYGRPGRHKERTQSRSGFFGFLQSHYHIFHRHNSDSLSPSQTDAESLARDSTSNTSSSIGNNITSGVSNEGSIRISMNKSPHTTVHSGYNVTISDFRAHTTLASTRSTGSGPTNVSDIVFGRRAFDSPMTLSRTGTCTSVGNRDTLVLDSNGRAVTPSSPSMSLATKKHSSGAAGDGSNKDMERKESVHSGLLASFRSLGMLNLVAASPSASVSSSTIATQPKPNSGFAVPSTPPQGALLTPWATGGHSAGGPTDDTPGVVSNTLTTIDTHSQTLTPSLSSPPPLSRCSGHGQRRNDQVGSAPPKSSSSKWATSAKLAFLNIKKKRSAHLPSHYLSLPVGGSTSSGTSGLYTLHSEDMSVTEFAKLAGITILSEEDAIIPPGMVPSTSTTAPSIITTAPGIDSATQGGYVMMTSNCFNSSNSGVAGQTGPVYDSAGDTVHSDVYPTYGSMTSESSCHRKKVNIWEPQFWTQPSREGSVGTQTPLTSASTTSLPLHPAPAPATPHSSEQQYSSQSEHPPPQCMSMTSAGSSRRESVAPMRSPPHSAGPRIESSAADVTQMVEPVPHERRSSYAPGTSLNSSRQESERCQTRSPPVGVSMKRVDLPTKPSKDTAQLSRNLSRRRSFSSLTAIAIELDSDHEQELLQSSLMSSVEGNVVGPQLVSSVAKRGSQVQIGYRPGTAETVRLSLEASNPQGRIPSAGILSPHPRPAISTTSRSLQNSPRMRGYGSTSCGRSANLCTGPSGPKTRSPSPSPLSKQFNISHSGWNEDASREQAKGTNGSLLPSPAISENSYQPQDNSRPRHQCEPVPERKGDVNLLSPLLHNRTNSLPLLRNEPSSPSPLPRSCASQGVGQLNPGPTTTPPFSNRSNDSSSSNRVLVPGMKVGRFTLVQEVCTKHVDMLKAQQQEQQQVQRRGSLDSQLNGGAHQTDSLIQGHEGDILSTVVVPGVADEANTKERPSENVVVFQRKKDRKLVVPAPSQLSQHFEKHQ
ncbi:hypothetical protein BG004_006439 [Podila humilis]|nr:hypothetical protein BG004_006439 [Podila humilis]